MTQTTGEVGDNKSFDDAVRLHPTIEAVAEHNVAKLRASGQPIAVLRAVHTGPGASKATSDDAGGLEPVICIAHGARVMLSAMERDRRRDQLKREEREHRRIRESIREKLKERRVSDRRSRIDDYRRRGY